MTIVQTAPFHGNIGELQSYSMMIVDTSMWPTTIQANAHLLQHELFLRLSDSEALCAWCITESVKRGVPELPVLGHYFVDRFEQAYDRIFFNQEFTMRNRIQPALERVGKAKCIRVLPMLEKTLISIGF
jgi:6-phosphogluconate dehydrogenase (decarboxylating)